MADKETETLAEQGKHMAHSMAEVFAFPSVYEGFGLPVLEAMACGTPVVTSTVSSLPEVAGDAALLVDPESVPEIAAAIDRLVKDTELAGSLRQRGLSRAAAFPWDATARTVLALLEQCVNGRTKTTDQATDARGRNTAADPRAPSALSSSW